MLPVLKGREEYISTTKTELEDKGNEMCAQHPSKKEKKIIILVERASACGDILYCLKNGFL